MLRFLSIFLLFLNAFLSVTSTDDPERLKLLGLTVATDETDGFKRFMRSADIFDIPIKVAGMHEEWKGGNMELHPGGGHKLNLLRKEIELLKNETDLVVMFTDSYDVVFAAGADEILKRFLAFKSKVVISAEDFLWPDKTLLDEYPEVTEGKRFLCSGGIIGYAPEVFQLMTHHEVKDTDDDQLYYTKLYLDAKLRNKLQMKLDHKSEIFQNLNGAKAESQLVADENSVWFENTLYGTKPVVLHGNGPSKLFLNYLANYIPKGWSPKEGCLSCLENTFSMDDYKTEDYPSVLVAVFVEAPTPFFSESLERLVSMEYPQSRIDVFIHNVEPYHEKQIQNFISTHGKSYNSVKYIAPGEYFSETKARNYALEYCLSKHCQYLFVIDSDVVLTEPKTLKILMEQNRSIIAPKLSKHGKLWSNFWGDIGSDGFYARSRDYVEIVNGNKKGVWNVPYIASSYLAHHTALRQVKNPYSSTTFEADMAFCASIRSKGIFMYVNNLMPFGRLLDTSIFTTTKKHGDMYEMVNNVLDWEAKYLHPDWYKLRTKEWKMPEPCPDVYWVPLFSETFALHLWQECEHFGGWSGGGHKDNRIAGGYENVPTVDIHMKQIAFEAHWMHFLKTYVAPIANHIFTGYYSEARAYMNFVVKYHPDKQFLLRPHHDSSTYTINVALNKRGVDYEGGGARFIRYDCSVQDTRVGWALMHPGRLTHQHEGLPTTNGTRYIMVSFIDP
ncbi:multifunctional procollagen lysine hydroxylase and glycosyltransferase LH3-like [Dendronephthya gigantea]|uniref:multifunctional procollagen lysine hydroxylase and glycosyltransferase LH3-like n=1 Tax=Dendronephthya gigantea TaxID=151771 RepID=UPI00106A5FD8|nr:multifunctional procollagen lysine hydroxylase and glycosyltransferase LH3-like [Dendronephthya gigantea]